MHDVESKQSTSASQDHQAPGQAAGKRTLTEALPSVQLKGDAPDTAAVHDSAQRGIATTATAPGVHTDHSISGNYLAEGRPDAGAQLRHGQTIGNEIGGATGRTFTVARRP